MAVDDLGNAFNSPDPGGGSDAWAGRGVTAGAPDPGGNGGTSPLLGVACLSAGFCLAVDGWGNAFSAGPTPASTAAPTISGDAVAGATLTATTGAWTLSPSAFDYQWERCDTAGEGCDDIYPEFDPTYVARDDDVGSTIRVLVFAANDNGFGTAAESIATAVVAPAPVAPPPPPPAPPPPAIAPRNTAAPSVGGTPRAGSTLECLAGTWAGTQPVSFGFRWLRDGAAISGATARAYTLVAADVSHAVSCEVAATNGAGTARAVSAAVRPRSGAGTLTVGRARPFGRLARVRLTCRGPSGTTCKVTLTLTRAAAPSRVSPRPSHARLGSRTVTLRAGHSTAAAVSLNTTGRRLLTSRRRLSASLAVTQITASGKRVRSTQRLTFTS